MLQQQRKRRCFEIGGGFLVIKLMDSSLSFEYSQNEFISDIYCAKFVRQLPTILKEIFISLGHLYKYIIEEPSRIIKITPAQLQVIIQAGDRAFTISIQLQKLEDLQQKDILLRQIFILNQQIKTDKINLNKQLTQSNKINQQLHQLLLSLQGQYHQRLRTVQELKEQVSRKRVEKALMKSKTRIKEERLLSLKEREGLCIQLDD